MFLSKYMNKYSWVMVNAALIIYAQCEVSSSAALTQYRAADGWSRLRIRGEDSRGDGGGGRLVKQMIGGCWKIVRSTGGASVQISRVHGEGSKKKKKEKEKKLKNQQALLPFLVFGSSPTVAHWRSTTLRYTAPTPTSSQSAGISEWQLCHREWKTGWDGISWTQHNSKRSEEGGNTWKPDCVRCFADTSHYSST